MAFSVSASAILMRVVSSDLRGRAQATYNSGFLVGGIAGPAFLHFGGLDTLASAYLNGAHLGDFSDMFREFRVDVSRYLAPAGGSNVLGVRQPAWTP